MEDIAIRVEGLSKTFKLPHEKASSIKSAVINFYRRDRGYELQQALRNVNFEIKKGEFFGIVGRNGSGKSTLLKTMAGIYAPDRGIVEVSGSLVPFIELGVGFNPELSGKENVFLNGALLGFNRKEMRAMYKDIVEFAEMERFMDQKLKNYSSGMQVRLAFSIAIRAQGDILLLDEVLAVGDSAFQRKCLDYFKQLKEAKRTVILVTHDMSSVRNLCTRAALMTSGRVDFVGDPEQVADLYDKQNESNVSLSAQRTPNIRGKAKIEEIVIKDPPQDGYGINDNVILQLSIKTKEPFRGLVGLQFTNKDGRLISGITSQFQIEPHQFVPDKKYSYEFSFPSKQLTQGNFSVDGVLYEVGRIEPIFYKQNMATFAAIGDERGWGEFTLNGNWAKKEQ